MRDEGTGSDRMMRKSALIVMGFAALFGGLRDTFTRHRVAAPFHLPPNTTPPLRRHHIYLVLCQPGNTGTHLSFSDWKRRSCVANSPRWAWAAGEVCYDTTRRKHLAGNTHTHTSTPTRTRSDIAGRKRRREQKNGTKNTPYYSEGDRSYEVTPRCPSFPLLQHFKDRGWVSLLLFKDVEIQRRVSAADTDLKRKWLREICPLRIRPSRTSTQVFLQLRNFGRKVQILLLSRLLHSYVGILFSSN